MLLFVKLRESDRIALFNNLKNKINFPLSEVYTMLNISKSSFFNYLAGRYPVPEELFYNWKNVTKTKIQNVQKVERQRYEEKAIPKIKLDNNLAEIFGILSDDDHYKCRLKIFS